MAGRQPWEGPHLASPEAAGATPGTCVTCTARSVARQQQELAAAEARIDDEFGPWMKERRRARVRVVDAASMNEQWKQARRELLREYEREEPWWRRASDQTIERVVDQEYERYIGDRNLAVGAFASNNVVYVSPDAPAGDVSHELLHEKFAKPGKRWLSNNAPSADVFNLMNESLAEYFNGQLGTPGNFDAKEYDSGVKAIREIRDELLGGPEEGESRLRALYFGGNPQPLVEQLDARGGVRTLFTEYEQRLDRLDNERGRAAAKRVFDELGAKQREYEQELARRAAERGAPETP